MLWRSEFLTVQCKSDHDHNLLIAHTLTYSSSLLVIELREQLSNCEKCHMHVSFPVIIAPCMVPHVEAFQKSLFSITCVRAWVCIREVCQEVRTMCDILWQRRTPFFDFSPVLYRQIKINNVSQGTTGPISSFISQFKSDCWSHRFPLICFVWNLAVRREAAQLSLLLTDF